MIVESNIVPANNEMVKYACLNYHYAESVPTGRKMSFAIFEEDRFVGVIIFSTGANNHIGVPFGLEQGEVIELTRVAFQQHENPVSYYLTRALRIIQEKSPRVKIIISYADVGRQGHIGKIYQATNWIYLGSVKSSTSEYWFKGKWTHRRTLSAYDKQTRAKMVATLPSREGSYKHKYIFVFDKKLRREYLKKAKPYPKGQENADMV